MSIGRPQTSSSKPAPNEVSLLQNQIKRGPLADKDKTPVPPPGGADNVLRWSVNRHRAPRHHAEGPHGRAK